MQKIAGRSRHTRKAYVEIGIAHFLSAPPIILPLISFSFTTDLCRHYLLIHIYLYFFIEHIVETYWHDHKILINYRGIFLHDIFEG